ncbi:LacI family DNA-binding transcriptional regulator [uncultured Prevotella sp.]|uniref:LacI family DNA-binding transcriptional regulator n=1 Tax=uncultured Prevotella sp. TaxID=159272 RepID=UPI00258DCE3C|nr:LacI family DNA-binding transcriptional regulator [uncultured Prevotella sp.]
MKHITIKDIAKSLCISVSTVSRALTDDKNIRKETRDMVMAEAKRLGYKRNPVAMNLKMGRSNTIGVIVPEMHTPYAAQVISGIQEILYRKNQKVVLAESDENAEQEYENLNMMEQFMVDGLIASMCSYRKNTDKYQQLAKQGMAIVFYDRIPYGMDMSQVLVDDNNDSFFMVEHLIRLGRRRIAYIQGPSDIYNKNPRGQGYREAMEKFKLYDPELIVRTGMTFKDGADAIDRLTSNGIDFDAVYAFTDTLAIGAMNRLQDIGKRVPDDVFVAGFSGTELSTIVSPRLTTMEPPLEEMGKKAAEMVMEKINNPEMECRKVILKTIMRKRESTGEKED